MLKTWNFFTILQLLNLLTKMILHFLPVSDSIENNSLTSKDTILVAIVTLIVMALLLLVAKRFKMVVHLFAVITIAGIFAEDAYLPQISAAQYGK